MDQQMIYSIYADASKLQCLSNKKNHLYSEITQIRNSNLFIGIFSKIALLFNIIRTNISEKITVYILLSKTKKFNAHFNTTLSDHKITNLEFYFDVVQKCHEMALKTIQNIPKQFSYKNKEVFSKFNYNTRFDSIDLDWLVFRKYKNPPIPSKELTNLLHEIKAKKSCNQIDKNKLDEAIRTASTEYKIHLMPKPEHFESVVNKLMTTIDNSPEMQRCLMAFKILKNPKIIKQNGQYVSLIVLYIDPDSNFHNEWFQENSAKNAQIALDILMKEFGDTSSLKGSNVIPRYNQKVDSLIYYSQGDSACKDLAKDAKMFTTIFDKEGIHFKGNENLLKIT